MERPNTRIKRNIDFISSLPDHLLHNIMTTLLTTKQAARMSFSSSRWEDIWTSLPTLNIDSREFIALKQPEEQESTYRVKMVHDSEKFTRFVNGLLFRRKNFDIITFSLSLHSDLSQYLEDVTNWVCSAMHLNPQVLRIDSFKDCYILPKCITCTSLVELHLSGCGVIESDEVNLPVLKKFTIANAAFFKNQLNSLLSGCPVLEDLWLNECFLSESEIAHGKLLRLTITSCKLATVHDNVSVCYLLYLFPSGITLNLPSLTTAHLHLHSSYKIRQGGKSLASFLCGLANVKFLELRIPWTFPKEDVLLEELPIFEKLQDFSVGAFCLCAPFSFVTRVLESSSNLKKLKLMPVRRCNNCHGKGDIASLHSDASLRAAILSKCKILEFLEIKY